MKVCSKCGIEKEIDKFVKNKKLPDGHTCVCTDCRKLYIRKYSQTQKSISTRKKYYENNKDKKREYQQLNKDHISKRNKIYREENKEKLKEYDRNRAAKKKEQDHLRYIKNKKEIDQRSSEWKRRNPERIKEAKRRSYEKMDLNGRLKLRMRNRINTAIKCKTSVPGRLMDLIGCNMDTFRGHLESLFKPGMTWENYGKNGWHIDHKKPCASFDLSDPEQQRLCFNYTNLQPLWAADNLKKGTKIMCNPCTFQWTRSKS